MPLDDIDPNVYPILSKILCPTNGPIKDGLELVKNAALLYDPKGFASATQALIALGNSSCRSQGGK